MEYGPAFQFYPGDWLGSERVALMTLEEEGAYIRLLAFCWRAGSIPSDIGRLKTLIGKGASTTLATTLSAMFQPDPNDGSRLVHDRLEKERQKQKEWREKSREGGKKSAAKRKKNKARVVQPPHQPNGNSSSSFASSSSSLDSKDSKPLPKPRPKKDEARTELNREVWESYKNAFFQRYGVDPVRNAKINGMISKYTQRLPAEEAPAVAAYYVFHQGGLYVQSKHCVDLLLRDAEKLRADWATRTQTTQKPRSKILEALAEANRLTGVSDETEGSPRLSGGNSFQLRLPR